MFKLENKIKLVIWDLDETFWQGTLSEEGVNYNQYNHDLIIELTNRGIVNSICSKNDFENVKKVLTEYKIWNYFVFPAIDWQPKGLMVKQIIEKMGLRAVNVLFIDDNLLNLNEVVHMNKDINVCEPKFIKDLLSSKYLEGKDDKKHSRLSQYKNLEKKVNDFELSTGSNIDFLKESNITVCLKHDCENEIDRIHELIERTNQLNFTKKRVKKDLLLKQFKDESIECGYISVKDKYGDYGITGFYMIIDNKLEHFLFSCRILNMYIESWLYKKINKPQLIIVGDVTSTLETDEDISFIKEMCSVNYNDIDATVKLSADIKEASKILFIGGCDLDQVIYYLNSPLIETEFNYVNSMNISIHKDNTTLLKQFIEYDKKFDDIILNIPILDINDINTKLNSIDWNILIFSPLNDYSRGLYKHKDTGFILPFDSFNIDWTNKENWINLPQHLSSLPKSFLLYLHDEFDFIGAITPEQFKKNLEWFIARFPNKQFIFLNGSEQKLKNVAKWEKGMEERHKVMNSVLFELNNNNENIHLIDINTIINSPSQHTDNLRHYEKSVYKNIADSIKELLKVVGIKDVKVVGYKSVFAKKLYKKIKHHIKKFSK
jgi:FkbH-like protein